MSKILKNLHSEFSKPQGVISWAINTIFMVVASVVNIAAFYLIEFVLCESKDCSSLVITGIWYDLSKMYLILAISTFVIAVYLFNKRELKKIYSTGIILAIGIPHIMIWLIPFAMSNELSTK